MQASALLAYRLHSPCPCMSYTTGSITASSLAGSQAGQLVEALYRTRRLSAEPSGLLAEENTLAHVQAERKILLTSLRSLSVLDVDSLS